MPMLSDEDIVSTERIYRGRLERAILKILSSIDGGPQLVSRLLSSLKGQYPADELKAMASHAGVTYDAEPKAPSRTASGRYLGDRYATFEYDDETSASDPEGRWQGGSDFYSRTYRVRVPKGLLNDGREDDVKIHEWIERNADKPIWLD